LNVISNTREPAPQLDGSGQLAVLLKNGTDHGGIFFGYSKHKGKVGSRHIASKRLATQVSVIRRLLARNQFSEMMASKLILTTLWGEVIAAI